MGGRQLADELLSANRLKKVAAGRSSLIAVVQILVRELSDACRKSLASLHPPVGTERRPCFFDSHR
jgi:hypothetical protein